MLPILISVCGMKGPCAVSIQDNHELSQFGSSEFSIEIKTFNIQHSKHRINDRSRATSGLSRTYYAQGVNDLSVHTEI